MELENDEEFSYNVFSDGYDLIQKTQDLCQLFECGDLFNEEHSLERNLKKLNKIKNLIDGYFLACESCLKNSYAKYHYRKHQESKKNNKDCSKIEKML